MNWKLVLAILACNVILMSASYTMLIPFLPLYLEKELFADPESVNMWTGATFAVAFGVCAIMSPIWGKMADTKGKKLMLLRSSVLISISYFLCTIIRTPFELFLVRALQGFAAGMWPACLALMSAYAPKSKIGISMGVMQSANICGGIVGPLIGGVLSSQFGMRSSFFIGGCAIALITIITIFFIKEPPKETIVKKDTKEKSVYKELLSNKNIRLILFTGCIAQMVILLLQPVLTRYVAILNGSDENILLLSGFVFSLSGFAGAIAAPFWGKQGQARGFFITEVVSLIAAGTIIALQSFPSSLIPFAILQFILGLCFSGIFPSANSMIINNTSPSQRGASFGLFFSAQQIGGTIGPLLGGLMATYLTLNYIFLFSGILTVLMGIFFFFKAPSEMRVPTNQFDENDINSSRNTDINNEEYLEKIKQEAILEIKEEALAKKAK